MMTAFKLMRWGLAASPFQPNYDPISLSIGTLASAATVAGSAVAAMGTLAAGRSQQKAANYQAAQLERQGEEEQAAAQRAAEELRRKQQLALSRLTTVAAHSGFSATDPTSLHLADEIGRYGAYQEAMTRYGGVSRRAGREAQADAARYEGEAARRGAGARALATILSGIGTLGGRYQQPPAASGPTGGAGGSYHYG
jgi:hypothetical protein